MRIESAAPVVAMEHRPVATRTPDDVVVPVIAVAGSSGKSTVVALLRAMLRSAGLRVFTNAEALRDRSDRLTPRDRLLLELAWPLPGRIDGLAVLAVTGLASDELPPGVSITDAAEALRRLVRATSGTVVVNADDAQALSVASSARVPLRRASLDDRSADATVHDGEVVVSDEGLLRRAGRLDETSLRSGALATDLLVAAAAALAVGTHVSDVRRAAHQYRPPADHFEILGTVGGVTWINDAAATRPGRSVAMIDRLGRPLLLIAGGRPGGQSLWRWARCCAAHSAHVLLFGTGGAPMADALIAAGALEKIVRCADIADAMQVARKLAVPGDTVVLSPGCLPEADGSPGAPFREAVLRLQPQQEAA
jgi:UDP-N-acetylmuramoylalanine--D-glutamate ligase